MKIADFGLARLVEGGIATRSGVTMGSPAYMSPEQCEGLELDGRSDLYSLGIVLYEVTTGYLPFEIKTVTDAIYKHMSVAPLSPRQVRPDLPIALNEVILRCLAKRPGDRFATATDLSTALQAVLNELGFSAPLRPQSHAADGADIARHGRHPAGPRRASGAGRRCRASMCSMSTGSSRICWRSARAASRSGGRQTTSSSSPIR